MDQGDETDRDVEETLDIGWELLSMLPKEELNRVDEEEIERYYHEDGAGEESDEASEESTEAEAEA